MKRSFLFFMMVCQILALVGCSGSNNTPTFTRRRDIYDIEIRLKEYKMTVEQMTAMQAEALGVLGLVKNFSTMVILTGALTVEENKIHPQVSVRVDDNPAAENTLKPADTSIILSSKLSDEYQQIVDQSASLGTYINMGCDLSENGIVKGLTKTEPVIGRDSVQIKAQVVYLCNFDQFKDVKVQVDGDLVVLSDVHLVVRGTGKAAGIMVRASSIQLEGRSYLVGLNTPVEKDTQLRPIIGVSARQVMGSGRLNIRVRDLPKVVTEQVNNPQE